VQKVLYNTGYRVVGGLSDDVNPTIGSRSTNPRQTATAQRKNQTTLKRVTFQIPLQPA
jgi:hypothetical protein